MLRALLRKVTIGKMFGLLFVALITVGGLIYISNKIGFEKYLYMLTRDRAELRGNVRFTMIREYFDAVKNNFTNILFGAPLSESSWIRHYGNNPHNSYVFAHANFGLVFLVMILTKSVGSGLKYMKHGSMLGFVLAGLLLRSFSDSPAFPGIYDSMFYLLIFEMPMFRSYRLSDGVPSGARGRLNSVYIPERKLT